MQANETLTRIDSLLIEAHKMLASDIHFRGGCRPRYRVDGQLVELEDAEPLTHVEIEGMMSSILSYTQKRAFEELQEIDFAYESPSLGRFRINYFRDHGGCAVAIRHIPRDILSLEQLNLPTSLESFAHLKSGLVLVTGAAGSGKSCTLAALLSLINENYGRYVITLEDPVEFTYERNQSLIHQRGLHENFTDFPSGMRAALRENPDVLMVGELRDLETTRLALNAAEMGMLVFSTLHSIGAAQSVDRFYNVFPPDEQAEIRTLLSHSLQGVVSQILLRRQGESGRIPATEVLFCNTPARNLIREGKCNDLTNIMQAGRSQGMVLMSDSLETLVRERKVDAEDAYTYVGRKDRLEKRARTRLEV